LVVLPMAIQRFDELFYAEHHRPKIKRNGGEKRRMVQLKNKYQ
tara:strand:- start:299 stop:427 length:129 start_codon:yes stop_codon:yes gene_type:complete